MQNYMPSEINMKLSSNDIEILNGWAGYLSFKPCFINWALGKCDQNVILVDKGNQGGGTSCVAKDYCSRILGLHPIEKKNIRPNTQIRVIRFASVSLPTESDEGGEIKNTQYIQFKKFFPDYLIKKDITVRRPAITIRDRQGGKDIIVEFTSYSQEVDTQAGHQRRSIWLDEKSPHSFYEEQHPRLIAADGDLIMSLTPAEGITTWIYENIFCKAGIVYNSPHIIKYLKEEYKENHSTIERIEDNPRIALIRAASDDNPTLDRNSIEDKMASYEDKTTMEVRRYGIFHQVSGLVFKEFDPSIHKISRDRYFPEGIPHKWVHARGIDFHEHTNWACGWIALSQDNEVFIYEEFNPSPDRMVTWEIGKEIVYRSKDYKYPLNLVDPRAAIRQLNTGLCPLDDLNRVFQEYKKDGIGTGGFWQTWDTKNLKGRDVVKERLKNSKLVGRPFNNRIVSNGKESYLPTLWILDNCVQTLNSFKNWRWEQWATKESRLTKEDKNKAEDRYSHFPIMIECIFKHPGFSIGRYRDSVLPDREPTYRNAFAGRA